MRYHAMNRIGCLGEVTAMSLTGGFGPSSKRLADQLLSKVLIQIIASDAHTIPPMEGRRFFPPGVNAAAKIVGEKEALRMVIEFPRPSSKV